MPRASQSSPPAQETAASLPRHRSLILIAILLALICFAVRIPLLHNSTQLPPDGHEYLNVAWNLANGYGFRKTIKWSYYKPHPVVHNALGARPIFYSLAITPIVKVTPKAWLPLALRTFSALLCMGTVFFAYLLWRRLYPPKVALAAGLVLAVQPGFMDIGTLPLTEPLLMFLLALCFYMAGRSRSWVGWGGVGLLVGLSYLTRPNGLFLLPIFVGYLLLQNRKGDEDRSGDTESEAEPLSSPEGEGDKGEGQSLFQPSALLLIGSLIAGFLLVALPFWIANSRANGSPLASDLQLAYAVRSVRDATWDGFGREYMRPLQFITTHPDQVLTEMYRQIWIMLPTFANSLPFLMAFVLFLRRRQMQGLSGAMLAFGALNLVFYCLSWNVTGATRYLLPSTFCFLGPLLLTVYSLKLPPLRLGRWTLAPMLLLIAFMIFWCQPWYKRLYESRMRDRMNYQRNPMYRVTAQWLENQNPPPDIAVASNNPWMIDYYTHLPTVVCPSFDSPERVREFVREYRVRYIIFFGDQYVGDRDERIMASKSYSRYYTLSPNVRIWEFPPSLWEAPSTP